MNRHQATRRALVATSILSTVFYSLLEYLLLLAIFTSPVWLIEIFGG